jgi:hypothetical protein
MFDPVSTYILIPDRSPRRVDAVTFRGFWQRQRLSRWRSRALMRQLAHDYWVARCCTAEESALVAEPLQAVA